MVLVTGPSGAGRTTAIRALEDLRFEVIDNLPLSLIEQVATGEARGPLAIGVDVRTRGFSAGNLLDIVSWMQEEPSVAGKLLSRLHARGSVTPVFRNPPPPPAGPRRPPS